MTKLMKQDVYTAVGSIKRNISKFKSEMFFSQFHCIITY